MERKLKSKGAFSLVELLIVMVIAGTLLALVVPQIGSVGNGVSIASAGSMLSSNLLLARQTAISLNRAVELRCYETSQSMISSASFGAFQIWVYDESGIQATPVGKVQFLPKGIILDAHPVNGSQKWTPAASTLIDSAPNSGTQKIPNTGADSCPYRAFRYRGNGSTNLDQKGPAGDNSNTWFFTIRSAVDGTEQQLPKNFFVIQVDPLNGQLRTFRP